MREEDYEWLARCVKAAFWILDNMGNGKQITKEKFIYTFVYALGYANEEFNREKFLEDCGIEQGKEKKV